MQMKVKTTIKFKDLKENKIREIGEEFTCTKKRFKEIQEYVEEVKAKDE